MFEIENLYNNQNVSFTQKKKGFRVLEHEEDMSVSPYSAQTAFFCSEMNVKKRQLLCDLSEGNVTIQAGAMQWKPEYTGDGLLMLEPTYKHLILIDLKDWNQSIVLDDGLFLACSSELKQKTVARSNLSSAVAGGEGLFNLGLEGDGIVCLEADCPKEELIEINLENDVLKVDGNFAIAWSGSLSFTVERSGKTLIGSAASGEGLVNVYRGTGKVLLAPVGNGNIMRNGFPGMQ